MTWRKRVFHVLVSAENIITGNAVSDCGFLAIIYTAARTEPTMASDPSNGGGFAA